MNLSPLPKLAFLGNNGRPLVGGKLFSYEAGTTTPQATYTDASGGQQNTNPILLDFRGEANVWLDPDLTYKLVLSPANDTDPPTHPIWTVDNIPGAGSATFGDLIPAADNAYFLGSPSRAWANLYIGANHAPVLDVASGNIGYYKRTAAETAAGVTPTNYYIPSNDVLGYAIPQRYGAVGDNSHDDTSAIVAANLVGFPVLIPYTALGYKTTATITFSNDVLCYGFLNPPASVGSASNNYDRFAVIIADSGYPIKRRIYGIKVQGSVTLRAANVSGIRNDCSNAILEACDTPQLNWGIVNRGYSVTFLKCNAWQCNYNLGGYARSSSLEINSMTVSGGNYDSPVTSSAEIATATIIAAFSDSLAAGNSHGVCMNFGEGANFDGGPFKVDNCIAVNFAGCYIETSASDSLMELGGTGDGNLRAVVISGCFFKTAKYAIKCGSGVQGLIVGQNFMTGITVSGLYLTSDIYGCSYANQVSVGSFATGQEVRIAFRSVAIGSVTFSNFSIEKDSLTRGVQYTPEPITKWYPSAAKLNAGDRTINTSSSSTVYYTSPSLTKSGNVASNVFTFGTPSDSYAFNGGDHIVTAPAGALYIRSVDYEAGTALLDGGTTANGAATISQVAATTASAA